MVADGLAVDLRARGVVPGFQVTQRLGQLSAHALGQRADEQHYEHVQGGEERPGSPDRLLRLVG